MQPTQIQQATQRDNSWLKDTLFLIFILGVLYFILLGTRPLFVPDEGRYAEIAREMVSANDFVTPYLNGIKYFEKPILFYWLEAGMIKLAGLNLWSLRSINALLGILGCLFTYWTARTLYDRRTGILAALILGTSTLYFVMAHMISLDLPVSVFLTITLDLFILGTQLAAPPSQRFCLWGAAFFAALAVLTKGLIGIVFPALIIFAWIAFMNEWRLLLRLPIISCLIIFFLVAAPWHILVGQRNPEFYYFYFIKQHFLRYTTLKVGHYQPAWFFIPNLIIGFFPWVVFLPQSIASIWPTSWKLRAEKKNELFFLIWASIIFLFFSFSKSKLIPYILPVLPPLAILTARYLHQAIATKQIKGMRSGYYCLVLLSAIIAAALFIFPRRTPLPDPQTATIFLYLAASTLILGSFISLVMAYKHYCKAVIVTIIASALFMLFGLASMPSIDTRTILPLANILNTKLRPGDEVIAYNQYYQDLPFYLQKRITILNWKNELSYGMEHQDTREWMIKDETFWQRWHSSQRVFALMGSIDYERFKQKFSNEKQFVIAKTINNVLISNQEDKLEIKPATDV